MPVQRITLLILSSVVFPSLLRSYAFIVVAKCHKLVCTSCLLIALNSAVTFLKNTLLLGLLICLLDQWYIPIAGLRKSEKTPIPRTNIRGALLRAAAHDASDRTLRRFNVCDRTPV